MDFFALAEKARRGLEQAGADISKHAKQVLQDPNRAAEDAKRIAGDLFQGVQQAATNFDLGRTTEQAIKHIQQAAASIDLSAAASDVQNTAAGTFKTINEAASRINIEQILANSHSDAERIANEVFNTINLPGAVQSANHWVQDGLSIAEQRFTTFDLSHTVTDAMRWVEAHPIQTALLVANILLLLAPELLTGPLLALAGFGAEGVAAGKHAHNCQFFPSKLTINRFSGCSMAS